MKLQETEDWLYAEGEDETKGVYVSALAELKKVSVICQTDFETAC